MLAPRRGEVWVTDFGSPVGHEQGYRRPAVVVSVDPFNATAASLAVVVPITTKSRGWSTHVEVRPGRSGVREVSWAKVEDIKSVSQLRLQDRIGVVDGAVLDGIGEIVARILAL